VECFSRKKFTILLHTKAQARTKIIEFINMVECKTKLKVEHLHGTGEGSSSMTIVIGKRLLTQTC